MQLEALAQEDESDHEAYPLNYTESVDSDLLFSNPDLSGKSLSRILRQAHLFK